jgi:hypothetical protein
LSVIVLIFKAIPEILALLKLIGEERSNAEVKSFLKLQNQALAACQSAKTDEEAQNAAKQLQDVIRNL